MLSLSVQYIVKPKSIPSRHHFRRWVKAALNNACPAAEITLRIVDYEEAQGLNQTYRHKEYATNVLTFDFNENISDRVNRPVFGDIVLCASVIEEEADKQNKPLFSHYAHLVVHGVLHLQGYDHLQEKDAHVMENLEIDILQRYKIANPYLSL